MVFTLKLIILFLHILLVKIYTLEIIEPLGPS